MKRILVVAGVAFAVPVFVAAPAHAASIEIEAEGPVIELNIYESIEAEPDIVEIGAGVSTTAPTAVEAMRQNAVQMQSVIDRIKRLGVAEKDIQTSGINLNARYDYNRTTEQNVFAGYQVSNRVSVKLRKIEETGAVLDALVVAGATDLSGPSFSIEDNTAAKTTARKRAIERANARAAEYAAMLGHDEYKVLEINESISGNGAPMVETAMRSADIQLTASPKSPVQPGMVSTGVSLTIKYELVDDEEAGGAEE